MCKLLVDSQIHNHCDSRVRHPFSLICELKTFLMFLRDSFNHSQVPKVLQKLGKKKSNELSSWIYSVAEVAEFLIRKVILDIFLC